MLSQSQECPGELRLVSLGVGVSICTEFIGLEEVPPMAVPRHGLTHLVFLINPAVVYSFISFTPRADLQQRERKVAGWLWELSGFAGAVFQHGQGWWLCQPHTQGRAVGCCSWWVLQSRAGLQESAGTAAAGCRWGPLDALQVSGCSFPKLDVPVLWPRAPSAMSGLVFSGGNLLNSGEIVRVKAGHRGVPGGNLHLYRLLSVRVLSASME